MKVQREAIESRITETEYFSPVGDNPSTTTTVIVRLDNGFEVVGTSAAVDPAAFDSEYGRHLAYEDAIRQLFPYFAFLLLESALQRKGGTFTAALLNLKNGKTVRREGDEYQFRMEKGSTDRLICEFMGGKTAVYSAPIGDLLATDWTTV